MLTGLALAIVYLAAFAGIVIMKKVQPNNRIYPVWVAMVCILFTLFVGWYVS